MAPVMSRSVSTLPPVFISVLVSLASTDREAMLGERRRRNTLGVISIGWMLPKCQLD